MASSFDIANIATNLLQNETLERGMHILNLWTWKMHPPKILLHITTINHNNSFFINDNERVVVFNGSLHCRHFFLLLWGPRNSNNMNSCIAQLLHLLV
jgi:hypothetical protein